MGKVHNKIEINDDNKSDRGENEYKFINYPNEEINENITSNNWIFFIVLLIIIIIKNILI